MSTDSEKQNRFEVPSSSPTVAGAMFFAQHREDLTWAIGQEMLARQVEELVTMITDAVERSRGSETWKFSSWMREQGALNEEEAIRIAHNYFDSKATYARRIEDSNFATVTEASLCRYVDNFLCYLSDLLRLIFQKYPDSLSSSEAVISVRDVFAYPSLDALLTWLTERTINDLSFKGFGDIETYYKNRFNFDIVPSASQREKLAFAIAARNLLVHRRGLVDERFLQMTQAKGYAVGNRVDITHRTWNDLIPTILQSVHDIDERAADNFRFQSAFVLAVNRPSRHETEEA